ncbi:MAG TPA: PilZ domain-containing protein [Candidatus Baltobacteraceae bacterium]|jgi:hypothetical protein|nr:PilZ domain-containing protein [Candidatus Baltobacteraceae bacterium]
MFEPESFVSLEYETTVSARGIAPANAVVEHIGRPDCRFRTIVLFDPGDIVDFCFGSSRSGEVAVRGTIVTRVVSGSRFVYVMNLDRMSAYELDALNDALARFDQSGLEALPEPVGISPMDGLTRSAVRVPANVDITFRTPSLDFQPAKAIDVSTSGMLMSSTVLLVPGVPVELRLPKDLTLAARVVTRQEAIGGTYLYGLAFTCVNERERTQLERYVDATADNGTKT